MRKDSTIDFRTKRFPQWMEQPHSPPQKQKGKTHRTWFPRLTSLVTSLSTSKAKNDIHNFQIKNILFIEDPNHYVHSIFSVSRNKENDRAARPGIYWTLHLTIYESLFWDQDYIDRVFVRGLDESKRWSMLPPNNAHLKQYAEVADRFTSLLAHFIDCNFYPTVYLTVTRGVARQLDTFSCGLFAASNLFVSLGGSTENLTTTYIPTGIRARFSIVVDGVDHYGVHIGTHCRYILFGSGSSPNTHHTFSFATRSIA
jgi:hypothetical protein